ncbi:MAG: hypothetical protein ACR2O8_08750 [Rhizobiaceae bacterium]
MGRNSGSNGTVVVTGPGSELNIGNGSNLTVGDFGTGTLHILNGGVVTSNNGNLGAGDGNDYNGVFGRGMGTAWVDGAGSQWNMTGGLWVGDNGEGNLSISNGGKVSTNNNVTIGNGATGIGAVVVTGMGSTLSAGSVLQVGGSGNGALTISDGGMVSVNGGNGKAELGKRNTSNSHINIGAKSGDSAVAPGTLAAGLIEFWRGSAGNPVTVTFNHTDLTGGYEFAASLDSRQTPADSHLILHENGHTNLNGDASTFTGFAKIDGGILAINHDFGGDVNVNDGGTLGGEGSIFGNVIVNSGGTIAPGNSVGTITVSNLTLEDGSLFEVEIDGFGTPDLVTVTSTFTFNGGTVTVSGPILVDQTYTILEASSVPAIPAAA